jgi:DNA-binding Lrp family transcriptional regulator
MPLQLDNYDVQILNSLLRDGRKSFREISRETGITHQQSKQGLPGLSMWVS